MAEHFRDELCFLLRRVFHKNNTIKGLQIDHVCNMMADVKEAGVLVQNRQDTPMLGPIDRAYVGACASAFELCKPSAYCSDVIQRYQEFKTTLYNSMHMNELIVQNLSFKIHIHCRLPYSYVQQCIWENFLKSVEHDIAIDSECDNCVDLNDYTTNAVVDMFIDTELSREIRILPLPRAPIFSEYELSKLQDCVSLIHFMCVMLPEDIPQKVCSKGMYANYEILPCVHMHYRIDVDEGEPRSRCVQRLVDMALLCGGIEINLQSAFWAHCHLPLEFSKWLLRYVTDPTCKLYQGLVQDLLLFPEIDQRIVTKIAAMMMHTCWRSEYRATHTP